MGVSGALALSWWYAVKDHDDMFVAVFAVGVFVLLLVLLFKYFSYSSGRTKRESSVPVGRPAAMFKAPVSKTTTQHQVQGIRENDREKAQENESGSESDSEPTDQSQAIKVRKPDQRITSTDKEIEKRTEKKKTNHKRKLHSESEGSGDEESGRKSNERVISKNLSDKKGRIAEENEPEIEYFQDEEDVEDDRVSLLSPTTRSRGASEVETTGTKSRTTSRSRGRSLSGDKVRRFTRSRGRSSSYGSDVSDGVDLEEEFADFDLV
jgi:hypothetical protein